LDNAYQIPMHTKTSTNTLTKLIIIISFISFQYSSWALGSGFSVLGFIFNLLIFKGPAAVIRVDVTRVGGVLIFDALRGVLYF
jgi:hypothetical protein